MQTQKAIEDDVRDLLKGVTVTEVQYKLSESVQNLLKPEYPDLTKGLHSLIQRSEVVWKPKFGGHKIVLRCDQNIALKIICNMADTTEYSTLQYLETYLPGIPAPRPHGLVKLGNCSLLFMSFMEGTTLEVAWPVMEYSQKQSVQNQLHSIFTELRSHIPQGREYAFGGVAGEGCKDLRRNVRHTKEPIWTVQEFDDWQFSNPHFGSPIYIEALRKLSPQVLPPRPVLSHNDLRPDNIIVEFRDGRYRVVGIIDWQYSGFYPEYYESTKVMNGMTPHEKSDWYLFIPECIAPNRYAQKYLLDALWWRNIE